MRAEGRCSGTGVPTSNRTAVQVDPSEDGSPSEVDLNPVIGWSSGARCEHSYFASSSVLRGTAGDRCDIRTVTQSAARSEQLRMSSPCSARIRPLRLEQRTHMDTDSVEGGIQLEETLAQALQLTVCSGAGVHSGLASVPPACGLPQPPQLARILLTNDRTWHSRARLGCVEHKSKLRRVQSGF